MRTPFGTVQPSVRKETRVLIIDDSAIVRKILTDVLSGEPDLKIVGAVPDAVAAWERLAELKPDVLTVDIEMPRMDGITFVRQLMATTPLPCIVISSAAQRGCERAVEALEAGAVEVLAKPFGPYSIGDLRSGLADKIRAAAQARVGRTRLPQGRPETGRPQAKGGVPPPGTLIAIGASTGGTEAVREVLQQMPRECPPIVIVQHIPPVFSRSFADRLNACCALAVREARDGDCLEPGTALLAPGDQHMTLRRAPMGLRIRLNSGPRVCYQRPSVEVLFQSLAQTSGLRVAGILLTGMGNDGAAGLKRMRDAGAFTIAQDESTSIVYGMPREAVRLGAAVKVLPLPGIANALCDWYAALAIPATA